MKIYRTAVVGCGALAQAMHLPNIRQNPRTRLAVTCDISRDAAAGCKEKFGAERFETDWRKVAEADDIDVIVLATHTNLRGELIIPALLAGKPVYTEKPLSIHRQEMVDIVKTSRETGVPVCVGHNRRSSPAMLEFKRLLSKAESGMIPPDASVDRRAGRKPIPEEGQMQILMRINDDARSWKEWIFWDEEGIMFAEMVHFIDLALWMNKGYPVKLYAEGSCRGNFTLIMRFNDGSITTLVHTMVGNFEYPKELFEATSNNITVAMDQHVEVRQMGLADEPALSVFPYAKESSWAAETGMTGYIHTIEQEQKAAQRERRAPRPLIVDKGHYRHLDRFLDFLEGRGENPCDVESAVPVNRIAAKFLESARLGTPVAVGPEDWHLPQMK